MFHLYAHISNRKNTQNIRKMKDKNVKDRIKTLVLLLRLPIK